MFGYVYLTINTYLNYRYVGQHQGSCFDPAYHGSGNVVNGDRDQYGTIHFDTVVLEWCDTEEDLDAAEIWHIADQRKIYGSMIVNISDGGSAPFRGKKHKPESIAQMVNKRTGLKRSESFKEKTRLRMLGTTMDETTRSKISNTLKGRSIDPQIVARSAASRTGQKRRQSTKDAIGAANSRTYSFTSPSGEVVSFIGLLKFCKENGLNQGCMTQVNLGNRVQHKGWTRWCDNITHT